MFFDRNHRETEVTSTRPVDSSGHDNVEVRRLRHQVHGGMLARKHGSQAGLQVHSHEVETNAERNVSSTELIDTHTFVLVNVCTVFTCVTLRVRDLRLHMC